MKYVIVGGICLVVGAFIGMFTIALISINHNTDEYCTEEAGCDE